MKKFSFALVLIVLGVIAAPAQSSSLVEGGCWLTGSSIDRLLPRVVEVCSDPDDLSDTDEWEPSNAGFVFSAQNQYSTFNALYANCQTDKAVDWNDYVITPDFTVVEFEYRALQAYLDDSAVTLTVTYQSGSASASNVQYAVNLAPDDTDWHTFYAVVNAPSWHRYHNLRFGLSWFDYPYGEVFDIRNISWTGRLSN